MRGRISFGEEIDGQVKAGRPDRDGKGSKKRGHVVKKKNGPLHVYRAGRSYPFLDPPVVHRIKCQLIVTSTP